MLNGTEAGQLGVKIERDVPVKMRDGVILRADVYRPDRGGAYPVLVHRTPYGKGSFEGFLFVKAGYIVVSQDARGRYASEGRSESMYRFTTHDAEDGYDTVEWAAKLPGSTGKVGTFGVSYDACLQWRLAPLRPPSLAVMAARSIPAQIWYGEGSTLRPGFRLGWWAGMATDMRRKANQPGIHTAQEHYILWQEESEKWINWLGWLELPEDFFGYETESVKYWLKNPHLDPLKLDEGCKEISVPNLDIVGWYDHANGDMLLFRTMVKEARTEAARTGSRIIIGPWPHASTSRRFGNIDFGPDAELDGPALQVLWFDYWLKGKENGVNKKPPVKIFVMGDNKWRDEQHWPLQRAKDRILYLTSDGHANTPSGDGKLVDEIPEGAATDKYCYDPNNPVPTPYGARKPMPADQRPLATRRDILVYQTERVEVTGNPVVELHATSSAPDTDWFARLIDVAPDGLVRDASMGMVRTRYRNGLAKPELIQPGEVIKYTIRMSPTSNAFLPGHRIRLDITSSDFPNYDRNHNTASDQNVDTTLAVANQTIHHGGDHTTRIVLPWVPNPEKAGQTEKTELTKSLIDAAAKGDRDGLESLIARDAEVNTEDEAGRTPLHYAAEKGHQKAVELLVSKGAVVDAGHEKGSTPLSLACDGDHKDVVEFLLAKGADVDVKVGRWVSTPLQSAASGGRRDVAELLIDKGANVNSSGQWGETPLRNYLRTRSKAERHS
jgi:putative CocE/NonD family hydrolase